MKRISIFIFIIALLISIPGCESKTQELRSKSPEGNHEVIVQGSKSGIDPWKLSIIQMKDGVQSKAYGEIPEFHAGDLTNETIIFKWENNEKCQLKLIEQDGVTRDLIVQF